MKQYQLILAIALLLPTLSTAQNKPRYLFSQARDIVKDTSTGLAWKRCSEGQTWSDETCNGKVRSFTYPEALNLVKDSTSWRLPTEQELEGIKDGRFFEEPYVHPKLFPATATERYWVKSELVECIGSLPCARTVSFEMISSPSTESIKDKYPIRLVRDK